MAKVTITIEDDGEHIKLQADFDPPTKKGERPTAAQEVACEVIEFLGKPPAIVDKK